MKRILFIATLILCCLSINAKEKNYIYNDNVQTDGSRVVSSIAQNIYSGWTEAASARIVAVVSSGDAYPSYFLKICFNEGKFTMNAGSVLLLKLADGSTLELYSDEIGPADYEYSVTKYGTNYYITPTYSITLEQMQRMIDNDVTKIRVQYSGGTFDRDIKKQKLSNLIKNAYPAIAKVLSEKKSVYDDF